jgi:hypothetical protein
MRGGGSSTASRGAAADTTITVRLRANTQTPLVDRIQVLFAADEGQRSFLE